jgi:hypothetical protein
MRASLRAGAAATGLLFTSACVDRYTVPPVQLEYLNGYDIHSEQTVQGATFTDKPYRLTTVQGGVVDYNSTKQLLLLGANGKPLAPPGPFELISLSENTFDAKPLVGQAVEVPLKDISSVQVAEYNSQKTTDFVVLLSTLFVVFACIAVIAVVHPGSGGGDSSVGIPPNTALK